MMNIQVIFYIGGCFAGELDLLNVKKYQFATPFVYKVSSHAPAHFLI
jgi:hypothetical protein